MTKAARRALRERFHENGRAQANLIDEDAEPGNRALRRHPPAKVEEAAMPAHLRRFRRALDKAMRGPKES